VKGKVFDDSLTHMVCKLHVSTKYLMIWLLGYPY